MPMKMSKEDIVKKCLRMKQEADVYRNNIAGTLNSLSKYARPSVGTVTTDRTERSPDSSSHVQLYDSTMMNSVEDHAAGIKAWMSPANSKWFSLKPHPSQRNKEIAIVYWQTVGEIFEELLNTSNFHAEDFEAITDGASLGTRALLLTAPSPYGVAQDKPFVAKRWDPNCFSMLEDADGFVGSTFLTEQFTPAQAAQKFGKDNLPDSVLKKFLEKPESQEKENYVLCVYYREPDEYDNDLITPDNMPIASNWVHEASKTLLRSSGYESFPVVVSRHLKWSGTPYGMPPAIKALADARQLNSLQCSLDLLIEVAANPRLLVPIEMEGNINLEPGGQTFYGDPNRVAKMWGHEGSYQEGEARVRMRRADIEKAFALDVFRTFRRITKEITATEAVEIRQESIELFSPVFSLMSTEHYERALIRMLILCMERGMLPLPPEELQEAGNRGPVIPTPKVQFTSRMALALANRHKAAVDETLQRRLGVAQIIGEAAYDDLNIPEALKLIDRGNGLPESLRRSDEEVAKIQQARAERQAREQELANAERLANAAGKAKGTALERAVS